jgi:ankyrin repeat protein
MGQRILDKACFYVGRRERRRLHRMLGKYTYLCSGVLGNVLLGLSLDDAKYLSWLIRSGVEPDARCCEHCDSNTSLMVASAMGLLDAVRVLLELGADVNAQNERGETALSYACAYDQFEVARSLVEYGADIQHIDHDGGTALDTAVCHASQSFRDWLVQLGAQRNLDHDPWPTPEEGGQAPFNTASGANADSEAGTKSEDNLLAT